MPELEWSRANGWKKTRGIDVTFMNGEFDVLRWQTTIIESGLDVPNANTILSTMQ
jgi:transcription-repair coupling factor (superfamily II helicase)